MGAIFLASCLLAQSCRQKGTADLRDTLPTLEQAIEHSAEKKNVTQAEEKCCPPSRTVAIKTALGGDKNVASNAIGLRFVAYNVANWLVLDERYDPEKKKKSEKNSPKPEKEKKAAVGFILAAKPDVLGVCEIGTQDDLLDVQARLKTAGLDLPHHHYTGGIDFTRHLGLLSRYPIVSTAKPVDTSYKIADKDFGMQRGILDATIKTPDARLWRFVGVHLKSKRDVEDGDQSVMRLREAELLRDHLDTIFKADPVVRLIAYGDFNDTKASSPVKIIMGPYNSPRGLSPIALKDSREEYWTHYWGREDIYSRIDYIMVSEAMRKDVSYDDCQILDPKDWQTASDHRPMLGVFR